MADRWDIMGVVNVTPDSFSDGGCFFDREAALAQAERLVAEGATLLDVGGESTRPGAEAVSAAEERDRVLPVIEQAARRFSVRISIDTSKAEVAEAALGVGATVVNDVTAGADPRMPEVVARAGCDVILMHMRGTPRTMQTDPRYPRGVVTEVREFLEQRREAFLAAGVAPERIWVDPGIGFGKTLTHNLELLRHLGVFQRVGARLVIGTSRKSFLARLEGDPSLPMEARDAGTLASNLWAYTRGARVFRVHDVGSLRRALRLWQAVEGELL